MDTFIEFGKPTGKYVDDHIECNLADRRTINAPMILPFGSYMGPSEAWVSQYKDEYFAMLARSGNQYYCLGFMPIWDKLTEKSGFPQKQVLYRSEKFLFLIDNDGDTVDLVIRSSNSTTWKRGVSITGDKIDVGSKTNTEPAVLGDKTKEKFELIYDWIGKLAKDIVTVAAAVPTAPPSDSTAVVIEVPIKKQLLSDIKSDHVNIEK